MNERGNRTARGSSRWPTTNDENVNLKPSRTANTERTTTVRAVTCS